MANFLLGRQKHLQIVFHAAASAVAVEFYSWFAAAATLAAGVISGRRGCNDCGGLCPSRYLFSLLLIWRLPWLLTSGLFQSDVAASLSDGWMPRAFRFLFQMSLYRRVVRPVCRDPETRSPYRMFFSIWPSSILHTWLSHRRRLCESYANILSLRLFDKPLALWFRPTKRYQWRRLRLRRLKAFNVSLDLSTESMSHCRIEGCLVRRPGTHSSLCWVSTWGCLTLSLIGGPWKWLYFL